MIGPLLPIVYDPLTPEEYAALERLRARYQSAPHLLTEQELARIRFVRWLAYSPGRRSDLDQPATGEDRLCLVTILGPEPGEPGLLTRGRSYLFRLWYWLVSENALVPTTDQTARAEDLAQDRS